MKLFLDMVVIAFSTAILFFQISRVLKGKSNILHLCGIMFYVVQVIPLILQVLFGVDEGLAVYPKILDAMQDNATGLVYDIFVVNTYIMLAVLAGCIPCKKRKLEDIGQFVGKIRNSATIKRLLFLGMYLTVVAAILSPEPGIYLEYSYFYTTRGNAILTNPSFLYYVEFVTPAVRLSLFCSIAYYYIYCGKNRNVSPVYISVLLIMWISGKRGMMILALLGILIVDIICGKYQNCAWKFIIKVVIFSSFSIGYFVIYSQLTGKGSSTSFFSLYSIYFGRMSNVMVAIYDKIYSNAILDYPGQSILFDLFFWIPRKMWNSKPIIYSKYFTAYVMNYMSTDIRWQFQVNIWTEFISNFGIFGPIVAAIVLYVIAKKSEESKSSAVYLVGMVFAVMFTVFGFEAIQQYIGIAWVAMQLLFGSKIKILIKNKASGLGK